MVFYIEACESGSMMENLPNDINGKWLVNILIWKPVSNTSENSS